MKNSVLALSLITAVLSCPAQAVTLSFGAPLSGVGPNAHVATLSYTQIGDGDDWVFTLATTDLASVFSASGAFVGALAVEVPGNRVASYAGGVPLGSVVGGVSTVELRNGGGPGGDFDFRIALGSGGDRLGSSEAVAWTWLDSGYSSFTQLALHVQGLSGNTGGNSSSIWYQSVVAAPVPEPAGALLLLAGVTVIGALARRRPGAG